MLFQRLLVLACLFAAASAQAQTNKGYQCKDGVCIFLIDVNATYTHVTAEGPMNAKWFSVGFGTGQGMQNGEAFIGYLDASNKPAVARRTLSGIGEPPASKGPASIIANPFGPFQPTGKWVLNFGLPRPQSLDLTKPVPMFAAYSTNAPTGSGADVKLGKHSATVTGFSLNTRDAAQNKAAQDALAAVAKKVADWTTQNPSGTAPVTSTSTTTPTPTATSTDTHITIPDANKAVNGPAASQAASKDNAASGTSLVTAAIAGFAGGLVLLA